MCDVTRLVVQMFLLLSLAIPQVVLGPVVLRPLVLASNILWPFIGHQPRIRPSDFNRGVCTFVVDDLCRVIRLCSLFGLPLTVHAKTTCSGEATVSTSVRSDLRFFVVTSDLLNWVSTCSRGECTFVVDDLCSVIRLCSMSGLP